MRKSFDSISNSAFRVSTRDSIPTGYLATYNGVQFNLAFDISSTIPCMNLDSRLLQITKQKKHIVSWAS